MRVGFDQETDWPGLALFPASSWTLGEVEPRTRPGPTWMLPGVFTLVWPPRLSSVRPGVFSNVKLGYNSICLSVVASCRCLNQPTSVSVHAVARNRRGFLWSCPPFIVPDRLSNLVKLVSSTSVSSWTVEGQMGFRQSPPQDTFILGEHEDDLKVSSLLVWNRVEPEKASCQKKRRSSKVNILLHQECRSACFYFSKDCFHLGTLVEYSVTWFFQVEI